MKIFLFALAALLSGTALYLTFHRTRLFLIGIRAKGRVTLWEQRREGMSRPSMLLHCPIVSFIGEDGKEYSIRGLGTSWKPKRDVYPIIYPPGQPEKAFLFTVHQFWAAPIAFIFLAICFSLIAFEPSFVTIERH